MPSARQILDGLEALANDWRSLAVAWHVAVGIALLAFALGWRPTRRVAGALLAAPLLSVAVLAGMGGNPFNATVFAVMAVVLAGLAFTLARVPVTAAGPGFSIAGGALIAFGWAYPHFLVDASWATYLYAAPLALIPCPTLSVVIGAAIVLDGLGSRWWSLILATGGILYGLIGWLRLGVVIDAALVAGAIVLGMVVWKPGRRDR